MTRKTALILGARSDIALAVAREFAAAGWDLQLAAREAGRLADDRADLELRHGIAVSLHDFDALAIEGHTAFVAGLPVLPDLVVCAVGFMGDQTASEGDPAAAVLVMRSNFEGPASILAVLGNAFEARGSGTLVGISSVAGERGRAVNYIYGSAKAGFTAFLSGLRNRLAKKGVHVVTVLPGFVATHMTEGMDLPARLTARPEEVATAIRSAVERRRDVIHVRRIWRFVMLVIRAIPERVFKTMRI
ncbi:SDR family oxidoreductase [Rhodobaculum claviforme]|uniref:Short-chain dehydrogenase n=1 Tax=Rhodobaculum claviforme TaxID=1549854 RepID=A0A934WI30_9RHOB|nr:SDR family oxidoreductase [Rhodobaculum claviforme]MBK5926327.1 short-chain dehydrogenase [Rhodobaculum claviforme]